MYRYLVRLLNIVLCVYLVFVVLAVAFTVKNFHVDPLVHDLLVMVAMPWSQFLEMVNALWGSEKVVSHWLILSAGIFVNTLIIFGIRKAVIQKHIRASRTDKAKTATDGAVLVKFLNIFTDVWTGESTSALLLDGFVRNDAEGVAIEVQGDAVALDRFLDRLKGEAPALARIDAVEACAAEARPVTGFAIEPSVAGPARTGIATDAAICDNCLAEQRKQVDITIPAQKFLSCVLRSGEIFGAGHIADILLGTENQKVLKFDHQNLSTYGIGKDLSHKQWLHLGQQLLQKGYLERNEHGSLLLTNQARQSLSERQPILGVLHDEKQPASLIGRAKTGD